MTSEGSDQRLRWLSRIVRAVVGAAILLIAVVITVWLVATKPAIDRSAPTEDARAVTAVVAERRPVARLWRGHGAARARDAANVAAEVAGVVAARPEGVEAGARVSAGDVIVRLDDADYANQLEAAQQAVAALTAQLSTLEAEEAQIAAQTAQIQEQIDITEEEIRRWAEAQASGAASGIEQLRLRGTLASLREALAALAGQTNQIPSRRERIEAEIGAQQNEALTALHNLERTRITAPIDGYLQSVDIDVGEFVAAGTPIARIVDLARIEIPVRVGASAFGRIRIGDEVEVSAPGPTQDSWSGRIARIAPEIDETRTLTVFLEVDQPGDWRLRAAADDTVAPDSASLRAPAGAPSPPLLPGRFVIASIRSAEPESLFLVPRFAVRDDRVFVAANGQEGAPLAALGPPARIAARQVEVLFHIQGEYPELDPGVREWAVIGDGLLEGDLVVTSNLDELEPGAAVAVRDTAKVSPPARPPLPAPADGARARDGVDPEALGDPEKDSGG